MTNKTFCHGNNVNNNSSGHSKTSHSLLSSTNKAAAASSTQSSSALANINNNSNSNITSNTSQINNHNGHTKPCSGGGKNEGNGGREGNVGTGVGGGIIKAYAHGIWYQEYDTIDNSVQQHIQLLQQQRQRFYSNNVGTAMSSFDLDASENVLRPDNVEMKNNKCQQQQHQQQQRRQHKCTKDNNDSNNNYANNNANPNNCDIVVVDIEDEQLYDESAPPPPLTNRITPSQYPINCRQTLLQESITANRQETVGHVLTANDNVVNDGDDDDDDDSLASMETLSDNVSIWIDGEKHWIAGVDAQTTCADLIWALLNYQTGQPEHTLNATATAAGVDGKVDASTAGHYSERAKEQQQPYRWNNKDIQTQSAINKTKVSGSASTSSHTTTISTITTSTGNINQSMPKNTKEENFKITQNSSRLTPPPPVHATTTETGYNATVLPCVPVTTFPFPPGITTAAQLAMEYVIVKQYHHCEEYLDGSTKVFDVLPPRNSQHKKECELLLRRLGPAPMSVYANNTTTTPQLSSLISTDKDSGMGSPVGSARSAKFRRRKHKSSQWLAQANTLHPKLSRCTTTGTANERLLKIILSQDETIQRQLSLLREKERQINKIEEEKHRKRERELGKNYLLETYLNGLDEAECEPEQQQDGEEIFIDEPYQQLIPAKSPMPSTSALLATSTTTNMMTSQKDALGMEMIMLDNFKPRESKKDKKKKRQKEKSTNDESKPSSTTVNRPRDREQRLLRLYGNETSNIPGSIVNDHERNEDDRCDDADNGDNKAEMEMEIFWLEKVYTLNKHLQKEEELAAKLHAKIRKHQLKKANQTQKEVQLEMDKLDNSLAMQCGSIRRVEANLMETNDQLQKKLLILERLSLEYLRQQETEQQSQEAEEAKQNLANESRPPVPQTGQLPQKSREMQKLSLSNIKSVAEVEQLQKLIAKPGFNMQGKELKNKMTSAINPPNAAADDDDPAPVVPRYAVSAMIHHHPDGGERHINPAFVVNNERNLISSSNASKTPYSTALITAQKIVGPTKASLDRQQAGMLFASTTPSPPPLCLLPPSLTVSSASSATSRTMSPVCVVLDKNMLSSLHVQNAKTIKKQMFHSQTTLTAATATATATPSALTPPPTTATPITSSILTTTAAAAATATAHANSLKATEMNAFPLKQPCQNFNQHMQLPTPLPLPAKLSLPVVSSTSPRTVPSAHLTSWPQHSHQIPDAGAVDPAASLAPIQATMAVALAASSSSSSSSSPASLMAMNTVDISQLGTLV